MSERPPVQRWWVTYVLVASAAIVAVVAAFDAVARVLAPLGHLALVVFLAIVVAFLLEPLVSRVERVLQRRTPAVLLTFLLTLAALAGLMALFAAPLLAESARLADQIPGYVSRLQSGEPITLLGFLVPDEIRVRASAAASEFGGRFAAQAVGIVVGLVNGVVDLLLVLVVSLYLLLDNRRIRTLGLRALPGEQRRRVETVEREVVRVFGAYVRGQLTLAAVICVAVSAALLALGVPYALLLGVFAGMFELIPVLGAILGAVPAVLVAAAQPFPLVVWVIVAFVVIQQVEANLLVPRISGQAVGLHPLAAMLALLVGLEVGGILGALFAVPVAGILWVFGASAIRARGTLTRKRT